MAISILDSKTKKFALESIVLYKELCEKKEYVLSKQLLRSATSVGANYREARNAISPNDFIFKLGICQKECDESIYWLELLKESDYINKDQFVLLENQADQLLRMIKSSILTTKQNQAKRGAN